MEEHALSKKCEPQCPLLLCECFLLDNSETNIHVEEPWYHCSVF